MEKEELKQPLSLLISNMFSKHHIIATILVSLLVLTGIIKYLNIDINVFLSNLISNHRDFILVIGFLLLSSLSVLIVSNLKTLKESLEFQHKNMIDDLNKINNIRYDENFNNIKDTIKELIDNNNNTSKDLKEVLKSVIYLTNTTRNIPSKNDLKILYPLRAMVLFQELTATLFDFLSKTRAEMDLTTLDANLRILRQEIKSSITSYKTDIILLSKQTLSNIIIPDIDDKLKDLEECVFDIIKDSSKSLESKYYSLSAYIVEFDSSTTPLLLDNLLLTNFTPDINSNGGSK